MTSPPGLRGVRPSGVNRTRPGGRPSAPPLEAACPSPCTATASIFSFPSDLAGCILSFARGRQLSFLSVAPLQPPPPTHTPDKEPRVPKNHKRDRNSLRKSLCSALHRRAWSHPCPRQLPSPAHPFALASLPAFHFSRELAEDCFGQFIRPGLGGWEPDLGSGGWPRRSRGPPDGL